MNYQVCGPFAIRRDGRIIDRDAKAKQDFWGSIDEKQEGLSGACGCYVLTIRNRVWYVGLTEKQSFRKECFQPHKIMQYDAALNEVAGVPSLIFLAKLTPKGAYSKPSSNGYRDIGLLEQLLIGAAIDRNKALRNVKDTKVLRTMNVPGFLNTRKGQSSRPAVKEFKLAMGL